MIIYNGEYIDISGYDKMILRSMFNRDVDILRQNLMLAVDVIEGLYGNGDDRVEALGDKYDTIQNLVNYIFSNWKELTE